MIVKICCVLAVFFCCSFAASPVSDTGLTQVDTVLVPVKILRNLGGGVYTGKISYNLTVGSNDSLVIGLDFVPMGGGAPIVPDSVFGTAIGIQSSANGINGQNDIFFRCKITGTPAASYQARLTINAALSNVESTTNSIIGQMTQTQKDQQLCAASASTPRMGADVSVGGKTLYGWYASNGGSGPCVALPGTNRLSDPRSACVHIRYGNHLCRCAGACQGILGQIQIRHRSAHVQFGPGPARRKRLGNVQRRPVFVGKMRCRMGQGSAKHGGHGHAQTFRM